MIFALVSIAHAQPRDPRQRDAGYIGKDIPQLEIDDCPAVDPSLSDARVRQIGSEHYERGETLYVQGDYEDSDLCLRLAAEGLENWYLPTVELYHLEGQSYPAPLRALTSRYNRWLHTHTWRAQIEAAMQRFGSTPCP